MQSQPGHQRRWQCFCVATAPVTGRSLCPEHLSLSPSSAHPFSSRSLLPRSSTQCLVFLVRELLPRKESTVKHQLLHLEESGTPAPGGRSPQHSPTPSHPSPLLPSTPPGLTHPSHCHGAQWPGGRQKSRGPSPASRAATQLKEIKRLPSARAAQAGPGPRLQAHPQSPEGAPSPQPPAFPRGSLSPKLLPGLRAERKRARAGHAQPHSSQPHASERPGPGTPACLQGVPPSTSR